MMLTSGIKIGVAVVGTAVVAGATYVIAKKKGLIGKHPVTKKDIIGNEDEEDAVELNYDDDIELEVEENSKKEDKKLSKILGIKSDNEEDEDDDATNAIFDFSKLEKSNTDEDVVDDDDEINEDDEFLKELSNNLASSVEIKFGDIDDTIDDDNDVIEDEELNETDDDKNAIAKFDLNGNSITDEESEDEDDDMADTETVLIGIILNTLEPSMVLDYKVVDGKISLFNNNTEVSLPVYDNRKFYFTLDEKHHKIFAYHSEDLYSCEELEDIESADINTTISKSIEENNEFLSAMAKSGEGHQDYETGYDTSIIILNKNKALKARKQLQNSEDVELFGFEYLDI